eukprot:15364385-Ditylum_brightwellii.AAC.1
MGWMGTVVTRGELVTLGVIWDRVRSGPVHQRPSHYHPCSGVVLLGTMMVTTDMVGADKGCTMVLASAVSMAVVVVEDNMLRVPCGFGMVAVALRFATAKGWIVGVECCTLLILQQCGLGQGGLHWRAVCVFALPSRGRWHVPCLGCTLYGLFEEIVGWEEEVHFFFAIWRAHGAASALASVALPFRWVVVASSWVLM